MMLLKAKEKKGEEENVLQWLKLGLPSALPFLFVTFECERRRERSRQVLLCWVDFGCFYQCEAEADRQLNVWLMRCLI